ncbi:D-ribitol-5-phosphate cytidylyltransferase isoform X2 [Girardinichthys multiradiatus]|uniref:D-ribitol-5-phosphate cytidylyltransferase isoform X2 n=1 Tax=Girardinichthys multiradiatus TaxID=208333 RepID=UPI001FAC38CF|nr:D-ribitol-5-phosphate cytidylyltransferase isoform X2 [Girardinichthys multiradiatus]
MEVSPVYRQSDDSQQDRPAHPQVFLTGEAQKSDHLRAGPCVDFPVSVVLPAGGTGERTGLQTPKQFCPFLGRPLISYTIESFERVSWIQTIMVVVAKENIGFMMDIVQQFQHNKVRVVPGGSTRHRSICNGVMALGEEGVREQEKPAASSRPKVVIIHDAVRPFVDEDFLHKIAVAAKKQGAAGSIRPLVSTVIATTSEGYLDHSLERAKYRASEMPQGFRYDVIYQAYQRCTESDLEFGTECLHLALQYSGINAKLIDGPPTLWKVTYKRDLAAAESIIKETLSQTACLITGGLEAGVTLANVLQKAFGALDVVDPSSLSEVEALLVALEAGNRVLLNPAVIIWMHLSVTAEPFTSMLAAESGALTGLAIKAKLRNILLYGIWLHQPQDSEQWERLASRVAEIASALIRERNPVFVGQLLQA